MRSACIFILMLGMSFMLNAQTNNVVHYKMKDLQSLREDYRNPNPAPLHQTHSFLKKQLNGNLPLSGGSRAVTTVPIGSAGNLYTILAGEINRIAANNDLNTVVFIHRSDPTFFPNDNIGQYRYDVSENGGASWTLNQGVLNPKGNQQTLAGRFPNAAIYNPTGNTNPDNAYLSYLGTWLPFDAGGSWDGLFTGVARLDNDTSTFTENVSTPNNSNLSIAAGLCNGAPGVFWAVAWDFDEVDIFGILVFKGVWNNTKEDIDWVEFRKLTPNFDKASQGTAQATSVNIAFDPTGQFGWIGFLGDVTPGGENVLDPVFYRTVDGGDNWTGPIVLNLQNFANVINDLTVTNIATTAFDQDMVVDANGNPHLVVVVGSSGQDYAISTGSGAGLKIYDFTYVPTAAPDCRWQAIFLDDVLTFRGTISPEVDEDNRPQASTSPDGTKVFFGWMDSDPSLTGGTNQLPNLKTRAYDVNTGRATQVVNWTDNDPLWSGSALFSSFAPTTLKSGSTYRIPTVFAEINISGLDTDPATFHYVQDVTYTDADFTVDIFAPVITLNGNSPITIVAGNAYTELGANASDNVDGNISANIAVNSSNVNTNTPGSYVVRYNVSDAAGNAACEVIRVVNVVAAPDVTAPVLTLIGANPLTIDVCQFFADPGATANDNVDGNITNNIVATSTVPSPLVIGSYTITYTVSDGAGNTTSVVRQVEVEDLPPTITLNGSATVNLELCNAFIDQGAVAFDYCLGTLTVTVSGSVNQNAVGNYTLTYTATDGVNPPVSINRTVNITPDVTPPSITLIGANPLYLYLGDNFNDPGAAAFDCADGNITPNIQANSNVNSTSRGSYTVVYTSADAAGNSVSASRTVIVNTEPDPDFYVASIVGARVTFRDTSLYNPTSWTWDFGNTFTLNTTNPTAVHNYLANGTYNVCLEARNIFNEPPFNKAVKKKCEDITLSTVGIDELALESFFSIFPNPTTGTVNIEINSTEIRNQVVVTIHDVVGKEVKAFNMDGATSGSTKTVDLSEHAAGVYLVRIQTDFGIVSKKVFLVKGQ